MTSDMGGNKMASSNFEAIQFNTEGVVIHQVDVLLNEDDSGLCHSITFERDFTLNKLNVKLLADSYIRSDELNGLEYKSQIVTDITSLDANSLELLLTRLNQLLTSMKRLER